jgi:hypothetical protein
VGDVVAATIAAKNFLPHARALARSLAEHHPGVPLYVLLTDEIDGCFAPEREPFHLVELREVLPDELRRLRHVFRYERRAAAAAVKPLLLRALLESGHQRVVLLDADTLVLGDVGPLLDPPGEILLCPHRLGPRRDQTSMEADLRLLLAGTFNAGALAVRAGASGHAFLRWWETRLELYCAPEVAAGYHHDQRWLDLVPGLFSGVVVLRDPAFDVAYWNLDERSPERSRLFHFSGFDPTSSRVSRYTGELTVDALGPHAAVYHEYRSRLLDAGYEEAVRWPYAFARFDDGSLVSDTMREIYRSKGEDVRQFGDPFVTTGPSSFRGWLAGAADVAEPRIARLWLEIHALRPDLQRAFPRPTKEDRDRFVEWIASSGAREYPDLG